MNESKVVSLRQKDEIDDPLTDSLRCGAKRLVQQAVEAEFAAFLAAHAELAKNCHELIAAAHLLLQGFQRVLAQRRQLRLAHRVLHPKQQAVIGMARKCAREGESLGKDRSDRRTIDSNRSRDPG